MRIRKAAAWGVHVYTASGLVLALVQIWALTRADAPLFFTMNWIACVIDATDGTLARRLEVKKVVPEFDGRRLDDIVDYLTFVFLPALALPAFGLLDGPWMWAAALPVLSSAYGFCQDRAKTDDAFVGFPSYWNILALYLYVLHPTPLVSTVVLAVLALLVFVPIHYLYPSRTRLLMPVTVALGVIWAAAMLAVGLAPNAEWARPLTLASLYYPAYYLVLSLVHDRRVRRATG
jgi:phosphatidylcholine synthase